MANKDKQGSKDPVSKLIKMTIQSELDVEALMAMVNRIRALGSVSVLGFDFQIEQEDKKIVEYARELFNLLPGELVSVAPFVDLQKDPIGLRKLRHFPSNHGSYTQWPFNDGATGVTVLVGGTGSSKSVLMTEGFTPDIILRVSEPHESFDMAGNVIHPVDLDDLFSTMIVLCSQRIAFGVDSFRKLAFELDGAAGSQGVIARLYTAMTDINNLCSFMDMNIPVVLNPMVKGLEAEEHVYSNMAGSVSGALLLVNGSVTKSLIRRDGRRSPIEPDDFIAKKASSMIKTNEEKLDADRTSISRAQVANNNNNKVPELVDIDGLTPHVAVGNYDMKEDEGFDEERSGSNITLMTE